MPYRCAILDDYQNCALQVADWSILGNEVEIKVFTDWLGGSDKVIAALKGFDIVCLMRERTRFDRSVIEALPDLKLIVTCGMRNAAIDVGFAKERGIPCLGTESAGYPDRGTRHRPDAGTGAQDRLGRPPHEERASVAVDARHRA